jgi:hypothetical protein
MLPPNLPKNLGNSMKSHSLVMIRELDLEDSHGVSPAVMFCGIICPVEHGFICAGLLTAKKIARRQVQEGYQLS